MSAPVEARSFGVTRMRLPCFVFAADDQGCGLWAFLSPTDSAVPSACTSGGEVLQHVFKIE